MKTPPRVGTVGEQRFTVEASHGIDFASDEMPMVLSTPWLIWFLEHAARAAVLPFLEPGESTVGIQIEVDHLAPTPVGDAVRCAAAVIYVEGALISFRLEAFDSRETIAKGFHRLRVIQARRFAERVRAKAIRTG
jgi:predicted thioesterase